ncbi:hypothetical protein [Anaplasma platys]|uniref:hypothetical protein n=1 Tax=Anaplasma platys TaxID=949 RepID=UPI00145F3597|nr:hypothetical protein [Anaplasma platys]
MVLGFAHKEHVRDFKEKCTTLDESIVSRAIFPDSVHIKYEGGNRVVLTPETTEFTFSSVSVMINHMIRHGFTTGDSVLGAMLEQIATNLPVEDKLVLRCVNDKPTFVVSVTHDAIDLAPVTERYVNPGAQGFRELVSQLNRDGAVSSVEVDSISRSIHVTPSGSICGALKALSLALDKAGAIVNNSGVLSQLMDMALADVTANELRTVRNISRYPVTHPLSRYKDAALTIEDILVGIRNRELNETIKRKLTAALKGSGEFSALPSVLTKGFAKLSKDFSGQLDKIIRNSLT